MQEVVVCGRRMGSSRMTFRGVVGMLLSMVVVLSCSNGRRSITVWAQQDNGGESSCGTSYSLRNGTRKTYTMCQNLEVQNATLAWTYFPGDNNATGGVLDLAFTNRLLSSSGWVGWGLNPTQQQMVGSSVLVAFTDSSTAESVVLPYKLDLAWFQTRSGPVSGPTDLDVLDSSVDIDGSSLLTTIFATLQLKPGQTNLYQIWNKGTSVEGRSPGPHDTTAKEYMTSVGLLDVVNGTVINGGDGTPALWNIHGVLNAISWGVLFPVGIMSSRYMKPFALFDPIWFYVHVGCQLCGYILGVAGFATGLKILDENDVKYKHRNLGIALFVFATVQMASLLMRPGPKHKLRKFWNVYHYVFGYAIVILSIINIFEGFDLLQPPKGWKRAYIGVIIALAAIALIFELSTWAVWLRRKLRVRQSSTEAPNGTHGANGAHGGKVEKDSYAPDAK